MENKEYIPQIGDVVRCINDGILLKRNLKINEIYIITTIIVNNFIKQHVRVKDKNHKEIPLMFYTWRFKLVGRQKKLSIKYVEYLLGITKMEV